MKQLQISLQSQPINLVVPLSRQLYLRFVFIILAGFSLTSFGVMAFSQSARPALAPSNPFLEYIDIFPGQSANALKVRTLSCYGVYNYDLPSDTSCSFDVKSGMFSRIETTLSTGVIRQISFTLRDDTLKVGNLVLLFDTAKFRAYPRKAFFFWNNLFVMVSTTIAGKPAAMRPVWTVTFTDRY